MCALHTVLDLEWEATEDALFSSVAKSGANLVSIEANHLSSALNSGLRKGVAVMVKQNQPSAHAVASIQQRVGCHPNFGGFDWSSYNLSDGLSQHAARQLEELRKAVQWYSPHCFALIRAESHTSVLQLSNATGLPMVALAQPHGLSSSDMIAGIATLSRTIAEVKRTVSSATGTANLVAIDVCTLSEAQVRLQAYAGLMFGASGILYTNLTASFSVCATSLEREAAIEARLSVATEINQNVARWSSLLAPTAVHQTQLITNDRIPGVQTSRPGGAKPTNLVIALSTADLVVGVYTPLGTDRQLNVSKSPPLLFVLDTRSSGGGRIANLTLNKTVVQWTPFCGNADAGFPDCAKVVLGNQPVLNLLPGQGVLIGLTQLLAPSRIEDTSSLDAVSTQWTRPKRGRKSMH